jgi:hypothetical protein
MAVFIALIDSGVDFVSGIRLVSTGTLAILQTLRRDGLVQNVITVHRRDTS